MKRVNELTELIQD